MPRISQLTTEQPNSTSDLPINVGSTTRRANVQQILSVPVTSQGDMLFGDSSADTTRLAPPTSGAVLAYSSASSAPSWSIPTSGAVLVASSVGLPTWRALGSSGQILESTGGTPTWVTAVDPSTGHITTAGTSGQILQTTAGAATWINQSDLTGTPDPSTGHITTAGTSGQVLQTTAGAAAWVNSTTIGDNTTNAWKVYRATSLALSTVGGWNPISWDAEEMDTDSFFTTGNSSVIIRVPGTYIIGASWQINAPTLPHYARIIEGSTGASTVLVQHGGSTSPFDRGTITVMRNFPSSGTAVEFNINGSSEAIGLSAGIFSAFWGHRLS